MGHLGGHLGVTWGDNESKTNLVVAPVSSLGCNNLGRLGLGTMKMIAELLKTNKTITNIK